MTAIGPEAVAQAVHYYGGQLAQGTPTEQAAALMILRKFGRGAGAVAPLVKDHLTAAISETEIIDLINALAAITPAQPDTVLTLLTIAQEITHSDSVRVAAIAAIGGYGVDASTAIDPLTLLLDPQKHQLAQALLSALGSIGHGTPQVVTALADVGTGEQWNPPERNIALNQLATMGMAAAEALPMLTAQLAMTQSDTITVATLTAIGAIGPQAISAIPLLRPLVVVEEASLLADTAASALAKIGEPATPTLITLLRPEWTPIVQRRATDALIAQGTMALPALNLALATEPLPIRLQIVQILEEIGPRSIQSILIALQDPDIAVREEAMSVLQNRFERYVEQNLPEQLRITAGFAVDEAIPLLIAALQTPDPERQQEAAITLGFIGPRAALAAPQLGIALTSTDHAVRCSAVLALIYIGPDAVAATPYLAEALRAQTRPEACELHDLGPRLVLSRRAHEAASGRVTALSRLNGEQIDRQILLLEALTILGAPAPSAVPALIDRLHDETQRRYAAEALRTVGVGAAPALAQLFTQPGAALSLSTDDIAPELADALTGMGNDLRRSAIYALPLIEPLPTDVRAALINLAYDSDEDPALRAMAKTVLAKQDHADLARRQGAPLQPPFLPPLADPALCPVWPAMHIQQPLRFDQYWELCLYPLPNTDAPTIDQIYQAIVQWLGG